MPCGSRKNPCPCSEMSRNNTKMNTCSPGIPHKNHQSQEWDVTEPQVKHSWAQAERPWLPKWLFLWFWHLLEVPILVYVLPQRALLEAFLISLAAHSPEVVMTLTFYIAQCIFSKWVTLRVCNWKLGFGICVLKLLVVSFLLQSNSLTYKQYFIHMALGKAKKNIACLTTNFSGSAISTTSPWKVFLIPGTCSSFCHCVLKCTVMQHGIPGYLKFLIETLILNYGKVTDVLWRSHQSWR